MKFFAGMLLGLIIGYSNALGNIVRTDKQDVKNGYTKKDGKIYKLTEIDIGKEGK